MAILRAVPDTAPKAVLYLRQSVSRDDSISIELQEIAGRDYCAKQGYEVVSVEKDEGLSGRNWSKRPAVQRVLDMIENRDAAVIVLWKWSRLSRNRKDWALAADRVEVAGGRIESATEPIDTATASGRFARGVMTEYAAFQSEQISEQWAEVHRRRFNMGLPPRGPYPFGWVATGDGIAPDPVNAPIVRELYQRYLAGQGFSSLASWLNRNGVRATRGGIWRAISLAGCLDSPIHAGLVLYDGETRDGLHEGIISAEEWRDYQALRKDRRRPRQPRTGNYLLSAMVRCHCGLKRAGSATRKRNSDGYYYSYKCPGESAHPNKSLIAWRVENAVFRWVESLPTVAARSGHAVAARADTDAFAREITAIESQLAKLTKHLVSGLVPEPVYRRTRDELTAEADSLREQLEDAERSSHLSGAVIIGKHADAAREIQLLDRPAQQRLVRTFLRVVTVNDDDTLTLETAWNEHVVIAT